MDILTIALDFGQSLRRGFYTKSKPNQPKLITMPPYCIKVPESALTTFKENYLSSHLSNPEDAAWLSCNDEWFLVGRLAREYHGELSLDERKLFAAEPTTLAIVGSIAKTYHLDSEFNIKLGILLPWGEYIDRKKYKEYIADSLSCFEFQGTEYRVNVEEFKCLPEGAGVFSKGRQPTNGKLLNVKQANILVLMIGYRNSSLLFIERGTPTRGITADLGMSWMIERVKERTAGYKNEQLIRAVSAAGPSVNEKALEPFVTNFSERHRKADLACLSSAIKDARAQYVHRLKEWLRPRLDNSLHEVIASGGTYQAFRNELSPYIRSLTRCTPHAAQGLEQRIIQLLGPEIRRDALHTRLVDVYGFFYFLKGVPLPQLQQGGAGNGKKK